MPPFGLTQLLAGKTVVGWSAGAMVLAPRIVLFHDRMPRGRREPELFGAGCGLIEGTVVLPNAAHRLRQRQRERLRLGLMARRFTPQRCIVLDYFHYDDFLEFCERHLGHLDKAAHAFFGTDTVRDAIRQKVEALYPDHEIDEFTVLFWNRIQTWREDDEAARA